MATALVGTVSASTSAETSRQASSIAGAHAAASGILPRGRAATARLKKIAKQKKISRQRLTAKQKRLKSGRLRAQTPEQVICRIFGRHCEEALAVARCESHLRTDATNGQYLGLFQMGSYARERYGHGNSALVQAKAAYRYFVDSGRDWSPWGCKP